jgi:YidC/Oxa1 family membrane protein insertase
MMDLRRALAAPFQMAFADLLAALAIALLGFSLMAGPVLAQDATPAPTATPAAAVQAAATTTAPSTATPATAAPSTALPTPAAAVGPTGTGAAASAGTPTAPSPTASPGVGASTAGPSPVPSLASGAHSTQDPCPDPYAPSPGATRDPKAPPLNLCPAQPGADPMSLLAWAFTPIFQVIFLGLAFFYQITGDIGIAIILLTILIRILLIPIFRAQIVSQRRMQMLQPELRAISTKYKGDRARISAEQMQLYKDRGVNPASGCLPSVLQLVLLLPMYQVFSQGLKAPDISSMLSPFGITLVNVQCQSTTDLAAPCINPDIPWLAWIPTLVGSGPVFPGYPGGLPANQPEIFVYLIFGLGLSLMALVSAGLQLVQTRMMTTQTDDPQQRTQQRMFLLLPLFSLVYGGILPAGLFIYWITTTIFSIVQQYLINGYGGLFPLFGWTPRFAVGHTPRFPVKMPQPKPQAPSVPGASSGPAKTPTSRTTTDSAAGTIRPARRRSSRRGRRR